MGGVWYPLIIETNSPLFTFMKCLAYNLGNIYIQIKFGTHIWFILYLFKTLEYVIQNSFFLLFVIKIFFIVSGLIVF